MIHQMNQVIGHAFVNHAPIMAYYVHNAVLKTLQEWGTPGFVGPAYQQASQMVFSPTGSATETSPVDPQAHADGNMVDVQPISTATPTHFLLCTPVPRQLVHIHREATCEGTRLAGILLLDLVCPQSIWCHVQQGNQAHWLHSRSISKLMHRLHR